MNTNVGDYVAHGWLHYINGTARPVFSKVRLNEVNAMNDGILRTLGIVSIEQVTADGIFQIRFVPSVENYASTVVGASF